MANSFSYGKCWSFGKMLREDVDGPWTDFFKNPHFLEFRGKHMLTDVQVYYIKLGFSGKSFEGESEQPTNEDNDIFPFGKYKGRHYKDLPDRYVLWLLEQDWIGKWPNVAVYAKRRADAIKENTPSKEEIKEMFSKVTE